MISEGEGYRTERDEVTGKIIKAHLSSERAKEMNAIATQNRSKETKRAGEELAEALIEVLIDKDDKKAAANTILIRKLAAAAVKDGGSQAIKSIEMAFNLLGKNTKTAIRPPIEGERCPTCGDVKGSTSTMQLSEAAARSIGETMAEILAKA